MVRAAAQTMMDIPLFACARCGVAFAPDDTVVLVVPFAERGPVVRMGDELLYHVACEPSRAGLRAVGRGTHGDIVAGLRQAYHPDVVDSDPA
jgi:hypothetical protein